MALQTQRKCSKRPKNDTKGHNFGSVDLNFFKLAKNVCFEGILSHAKNQDRFPSPVRSSGSSNTRKLLKRVEKAKCVILWSGRCTLWKKMEQMFLLRCLVDLGHHPCRVSDRHGSLCILLYRSDILYIVASVMLYRRDIPCLLPFLMLLQR